MKTRDLENALFREWKELETKLNHSATFVSDGIVDPSSWASTSPRIIFILKEANEKKKAGQAVDWDLREFLLNGAKSGGSTWNNVHRWTLARDLDVGEGDPRMWKISPGTRAGTLCQIGAVNLKKVPGGGDCDEADLKAAAEMRRGLLIRQLKLYADQADLFVACGKIVSHLLRSQLGFGSGPPAPGKGTRAEMVKGLGLLLHWRHPNARGTRSKDLLKAWKLATSELPGFRGRVK